MLDNIERGMEQASASTGVGPNARPVTVPTDLVYQCLAVNMLAEAVYQ